MLLDGHMIISAAMPVEDAQGRFVGVLAIDLSLAHLSEVITGIRIGENGYPFVFDSNLNLMIHPDPALLGQPSGVPELEAFINKTINKGKASNKAHQGPRICMQWYST